MVAQATMIPPFILKKVLPQKLCFNVIKRASKSNNDVARTTNAERRLFKILTPSSLLGRQKLLGKIVRVIP
jgi:hypothetical protein